MILCAPDDAIRIIMNILYCVGYEQNLRDGCNKPLNIKCNNIIIIECGAAKCKSIRAKCTTSKRHRTVCCKLFIRELLPLLAMNSNLMHIAWLSD